MGQPTGWSRHIQLLLRCVVTASGLDRRHPEGDVSRSTGRDLQGSGAAEGSTDPRRSVGEGDVGQGPRPRHREDSLRQRPTPAQVRAILDAADERFVGFIAVCAFAGLRLGEAAALKFDDVDFLRRQLRVRRQVQRAGGGQVEIRLPKYGSERDVPLPDELLAVLSRHVDLGHRGDWLFAGGEDNPPHQNTIGYWWRKTLAAAGQEGIRLHDLRHFYASGLIAAGCDVVTVQRALGHAKPSTTLETYSHLWPSAEDKTRKAASTLVEEVLGATGGRKGASDTN